MSRTNCTEDMRVRLEQLIQDYDKLDVEKQQLQEKNIELTKTLMDRCSNLGHVEAQKEELLSTVRLQNEEIGNHKNVIANMTEKLKASHSYNKELETVLKQRTNELIQFQENHVDCANQKHFKSELESLTKALKNKESETESFKTKIIELTKRQQLSDEREKCLQDIIKSLRLKQDRLMDELSMHRELCNRDNKRLFLRNTSDSLSSMNSAIREDGNVHKTDVSEDKPEKESCKLKINNLSDDCFCNDRNLCLYKVNVDVGTTNDCTSNNRSNGRVPDTSVSTHCVSSKEANMQTNTESNTLSVPRHEQQHLSTDDGSQSPFIKISKNNVEFQFNEMYNKFITDLDISSLNSSFASHLDDVNFDDEPEFEEGNSYLNHTMSPSGKLLRILKESKEMVNKLEMSNKIFMK